MGERSSVSEEPWVERFKPRTIREIVGNEGAVREFISWLKAWDEGRFRCLKCGARFHSKSEIFKHIKSEHPRIRRPDLYVADETAAFLYGPPGTGKTVCVEVVARELGYDLIEVNASDYRTAARLKEVVERASTQPVSVFGRKRMIFFDELEGLSGKGDRGAIEEIVRIIEKTMCPIVLSATTVGDGWEDKFRPLMKSSRLIRFDRVPKELVVKRLREICRLAGVEASEDALEVIADASNGDLRSAINDLQAATRGRKALTVEDVLWLSERDRKSEITEVLVRLFSSKTVSEAKDVAGSTYMDYESLFEYVYENVPMFVDDPEDLWRAMELIARADIFLSRAKKTRSWGLLKYFFDHMSLGVVVPTRRPNTAKQLKKALKAAGVDLRRLEVVEGRDGIVVRTRGWVREWAVVNEVVRNFGGSWVFGERVWRVPYIKPPGRVRAMKVTKSLRGLRDGICARISERCHLSRAKALKYYLPYLKAIFKLNPEEGERIARWLDLTDEMVSYLRESPP